MLCAVTELLLLKTLILNIPQHISLYIKQSLKGCYFYQVCSLNISINCRLQDWFTPGFPTVQRQSFAEAAKLDSS